MVNLLEPWGLAGLAALLPILALYFLKLRREQHLVPSTLLWKKVIEDLHVNAPFQRLRYSLLLLLQLILVAILAFALARPFLAMASLQGRSIVMVVDTSASMGTRDAGPAQDRTRLEAAVQDALAKVEDLERGAEMRVVAFDEEIRQLTGFTSDRSILRNALRPLQPRHLRTRAQEALETALVLASERENCEVLLLSDGCFGRLSQQRLIETATRGGGLQNIEDIREILQRIRIRPVLYGRQVSDNVGLTAIHARTRTEAGKRRTLVSVTVENFSPKDVEVLVTISTEGPNSRSSRKTAGLKGRPRGTAAPIEADNADLEAARARLDFSLAEEATGVLTARLEPPDSFMLDNQAWVVAGWSEGTRLLLVSPGNRILLKAFAAMNAAMPDLETTVQTPEEFQKEWQAKGPRAVEEYDAVFFEEWAPEHWRDGGAVFFNARPPVEGFESREPAVLEGPPVVDWDAAHPLMRYVKFRNVLVGKAQHWKAPRTAKVLVETANAPLLVAYETDRVRVVGIPFSVFDSDWALRTSLPVFLKNAVLWVSEVSPRRRLAAQRTNEPLLFPPTAGAPSAVLELPGGESRSIQLSEDLKTAFRETERAGVYRLSGLPESPKSARAFAVNLADTAESDNAAGGELRVGDEVVRSSPTAIVARREVWLWLVLAAAAVLVVEWWVYHRRLGR